MYMDPNIIKLRKNLNTFTLEELKKEVINMKELKFAVTRMKRTQVIQLIINNHDLFPHLLNETDTKRQGKPVPKEYIPPASIKLPLNYLEN